MAVKRLALTAFLFLFPALAKADSFVDVTLQPRTFTGLAFSPVIVGSETLSATFLWDTTTNVFSDINVTASGILGTDWTGAQVTAPGRTRIFFSNAAGDNVVWSASTDLYPPVSQDQVFSSTPGVYRLGLLELDCASCFAIKTGHLQPETATVTAVSTPEASSLTSLLAGIVALVLAFYAAKRRVLTTLDSFERLRV